MNFCPDQQLLRLVSALSKKFNWLTGKDNFWLSYQLIIAGGVIFVVNSYIIVYDLVAAIVIGIMTLAFILLIKTMEEYKTEFSETKILVVELFFLMLRVEFLIASLCGIFLFLTDSTNNRVTITVLWSSCWTLALYLASVDNPPFSKSKAWEWLKDQTQFGLSVLKPISVDNRR